MEIESYGLSDTGCVRPENEDRILSDPSVGFYAVCDGMGGHQRGDVAAEIAISAMGHYAKASADRFDVSWPFGYKYELSIEANRMVTGIKLANHQVWRRAEQELEYAGMGTTIAAVLLDGRQFVAGNVGDSRIYRLRQEELLQLSVDDTMIASMVQRGLLREEETRKHPLRNVLTQAAGSQEAVEVHLHEGILEPGDILLLCSDGLYGAVARDHIRSILQNGEKLDVRVRRLIEAARTAGAPDNVSAVVLLYS